LPLSADPTPLLPEGECPSNLSALNLLYDLTPPKYITAIASEAGLSGPESVAILLRDYKSILFGS
jgi:translation initiation factor eIF-2B subunit delta